MVVDFSLGAQFCNVDIVRLGLGIEENWPLDQKGLGVLCERKMPSKESSVEKEVGWPKKLGSLIMPCTLLNEN